MIISPSNQVAEDEREQLKHETARLRNALTMSEEVVENDENNEIVMETLEMSPAEMTIEDLRRCLDLNLNYQATVQSYLDLVRKTKAKIEQEIAERKKEADVEEETRTGRIVKERFIPVVKRPAPPTFYSFKRPYFKEVYGLFVPPNQDIQLKTLKGECLPVEEYYESGWVWYNEKMGQQLAREVRRECLAKLLEPHVAYRDELRILVKELDGEALEEAERDLQAAEENIKKLVRESDNDELYSNQSLIERVDWMKISKKLEGIVTFLTCRLVWCNYYSPLVNKHPFTKEEDQKLKQFVAEFKERNWSQVAAKLGSGRTTFQCAQRYYSKFATRESDQHYRLHQYLRWSPEDEKRLMDVVASFDLTLSEKEFATKYIDWRFVSQNVGHHNSMECCEKYIRLSSQINLGLWSDEEKKRLVEAVEYFGNDWVSVSNHVVTRSPVQCAAHWTNRIYPKRVKALLQEQPPPEWLPEEDAILWFNRNSKLKFLRNFNEIKRLLPRRHKVELISRFHLLKTWHRQAVLLVRTEGTFMSLLVKSDADLTLAEVDKLRVELSSLQATRRKKAKTAEEVEAVCNVTLAEESQLERLINAMVVEASLSQDLVRDKLQLIRDIVDYKAVPVPLMEKISSTNPNFFDNRMAVMGKIKEYLVKITAQRQKKQFESDMSCLNAEIDADFAENETETAITPKKRTKMSPGNFSTILAKIQRALKNPATAVQARQVLLKLNSVNGCTFVGDLLKMTRALENLSRQVNPRHEDRLVTMPTPNQFTDYRFRTAHFFKQYSVYRTYTRLRQFYSMLADEPGVKNGKQITIDYSAMDETAKCLVTALGTNVEGVLAEAIQQRDTEDSFIAAANDDEDASEPVKTISLDLGADSKSPVTEQFFRRMHDNIAIHALSSPINDNTTARGAFKSIWHEFKETVGVTPLDFGGNDLSPVFPPCQTLSNAYRVLTMSKLRLQDVINAHCKTALERESLTKKLQHLKERPTEGYALLQRRFEALFTWSAILSRVMPESYDSRCPFGKSEPPLTPGDIEDTELLPSDEENEKPWPDEKEMRTGKMPQKPKGKNPFSSSRKRHYRRAYYRGRGYDIDHRPTMHPKVYDNPNRPPSVPPEKPPPKSERISSMLKEGRFPQTLAEPTTTKTRAQIFAEKMKREALKSPTRKKDADIQLKMLVPLVPVVPLENLPFPPSRIPNVPKVKKPTTKLLLSNRAFALAVADRIIEKEQQKQKAESSRKQPATRKMLDLSAEPEPGTPLKSEPVSTKTPKSALQKSAKKTTAEKPKGKSRTGLKRGFTRSGPSPDVDTEVQQPKRQKTAEDHQPSISAMDVDSPPPNEMAVSPIKVAPSSNKASDVPLPPKQKYYYRLKNLGSPMSDQVISTPSSTTNQSTPANITTTAKMPITTTAKRGPVSRKKQPTSDEPQVTPLVQRVSQSNAVQSTPTPAQTQPAATPTAQFPTSIISGATPGQAVALIQLNQEDIMRLFQSGASSVAIAIALPPSSGQPLVINNNNNNTPAQQKEN